MESKDLDRGIARVGAAWFATGVLCILIGLYLGQAAHCECFSNEVDYVFLGGASAFVGIGLAASRGKIAKLIRTLNQEKSHN